ncbi:ABC transporter C family member 8 [Spatholobus suberectus]|nr:ABC transporter C family member 8 [Spatholobus suberectus]
MVKTGVTGQRQLFCLGRVLRKRNMILVLDNKATASIDSVADAILQRVITQEFSESTVPTVVHRAPNWKLVEYDDP